MHLLKCGPVQQCSTAFRCYKSTSTHLLEPFLRARPALRATEVGTRLLQWLA